MGDKAGDPEKLEREIESSRADLAQAIDALADRVSPKRVARRGARRLKDGALSLTATVGGALRPFDADAEAGAMAGGNGSGPSADEGHPADDTADDTEDLAGGVDLGAPRARRGGVSPAVVLAGAGIALAVTAVAVIAIRRRRRR